MNEETIIDQLISELDRILPPIFARSKIDRYLGGIVSPGYMATLDSERKGPDGSIRCGRHICYTKKPFLLWLRNRMTKPETRRGITIPPARETANALLKSLHEFSGK